MTATIIAVGIDAYNISTRPLVKSIRQHEFGTQIVYVNNAAPDIAPLDAYVMSVQLPQRVSMSEAMNAGAKGIRSNWLVFMNNDVLCTGPFMDMLDSLPQDTIYGVDMLDWWGRRWLDGWIMAVPRKVWRAVGEFDPNFTYAGFEDADYCFRALEKGYKVEAAPLPFVHRELHSRFAMPNYMAQRERNIEYLCQKWSITR